MKLLAPAKINLYLRIIRKRPDGYHTLKTIFQTVSLYDEITIVRRTAGIELKVLENDSSCPCGPKNIVWKAAEAFLKKFCIREGCAITLKKTIPSQAGLGGGSSDAAQTLLGLSKLFFKKHADRHKHKRTLHLIAKELGADVPFFLEGGCALASGIGERLTPIKHYPRFWAVLLKPKIGCSTPDAYRWWDERKISLTAEDHFNKMAALIRSKKGLSCWGPYIFNSFEDVVFHRLPELKALKEKLHKLGARFALLSGSGSALFGIVSSKRYGEKLLQEMAGFCEGIWLVHSC